MSDCPHNDHSHVLIWFWIVMLALQCGMCSGHGCIEDRIDYLEQHCR